MGLHGLFLAAAALLAAPAPPSPAAESRLSKPEYERKVQALYADVTAAFQQTRGVSGRALADRIGSAQEALRKAAAELRAARPPADVAEENRRLGEAMRAYARALEPARKAAGRGDAETLARFQDVSRSPAVREMAEAAEAMKYKGYQLGPIAKD